MLHFLVEVAEILIEIMVSYVILLLFLLRRHALVLCSDVLRDDL